MAPPTPAPSNSSLYGTDSYNADSDLTVAGGTIFTNTGIIQVNNSAGSRFITGNFVNAGTINVVGVSLQVNRNASSYSFTLASGSINGTGGLYVEAGAFNVNGGSPLTDVYAQGSILTVAASETNTTLIYATGGSTTLATNLSTTTTIQVEGIFQRHRRTRNRHSHPGRWCHQRRHHRTPVVWHRRLQRRQ